MQKQRNARTRRGEKGREGSLFVFGTHCAALLGSQQSSGRPGRGKTGFSPEVCTMYIVHVHNDAWTKAAVLLAEGFISDLRGAGPEDDEYKIKSKITEDSWS